MTVWCTAGASRKRRPSRRRFRRGWRNANWRCIPPKPRSFTARMENAEGGIRTSSLTSSDTSSGRAWFKNRKTGSLFCSFIPAVSPSALKSMRATIRDLNIRAMDPSVAGRHRRKAQSAPQGLDRVLWPIRGPAAGTHAPPRQLDASAVGDAEVQALCGAQGRGCPFPGTAGQDTAPTCSCTGASA